MIESKIVQKFGNGGHIVLSKEYVGKKVKFLLDTKSFNDIKSEILDILEPYLENILGVYLHGSYAINEQSPESDINILVVVGEYEKIDDVDDYSIDTISLKGLEKKLKEDAIFIIPKLSEAKTIINPELLKGYKDCRFTKGNTKYYLEQTKIIINLNKTWIKMGYGLGVSSLISVIRGLYMIKWENYSKSSFLGFLEDHGLDTGKLYELYYKEQRRIKVKDSSTVSKEDLRKLVKLAEEMLSVRKN